ncbi:hypothetical protein A9P82_13640 [Arachidicoccus ginsenosidimutans]|uniref:hypothetical protein n=1 Tax=Arachidicoccus sp. BS20 TaxID=1850526 RepID=UPI0007F152B3|nr:hypothetical protein [Arachidicoccus sp. BS20]ANI90241.1 hypothetical protein A9P82_13640 [Arachidicoccus sp. BS20]
MSDILGTIIASILSYDQLTQEIREAAVFSAPHSSYAPCDGRSIQNSCLNRNTGQINAPDLRGKFLRGLNTIYSVGQPLPFDPNTHGDPDGANRTANDYQPDTIGQHAHNVIGHFLEASGGSGFNGYGFESNSRQGNKTYTTDNSGNGINSETRPRNVAVYYYIKIN